MGEASSATIEKPISGVKSERRIPLLAAFPDLAKLLSSSQGVIGNVAALESRFNGMVTDGEVHNVYALITQYLRGENKNLPCGVTYTSIREHYGLK